MAFRSKITPVLQAKPTRSYRISDYQLSNPIRPNDNTSVLKRKKKSTNAVGETSAMFKKS